MRKVLGLMTAVSLVAVLAVSARADWDEGDGHKMHYPQLPDPFGIDVAFNTPQVLADDWRCSETGPVSDVHFWFSSFNDITPDVQQVHISIHENIPADPGGFSQPGALLWERDFFPTEFNWRPYGTGQQGWYDPATDNYVPDNHNLIFQLNIMNIPDPFIQQLGTVYWLDVSVVSPTSRLGWKTSGSPQFMDTSVWGTLPAPAWKPIYDPRDPSAQVPLDLAFVITPEPGTLVLLAFAALTLRRR